MRKLLSIVTTLSLIVGCVEVPTECLKGKDDKANDDKTYLADLDEAGCEMTVLAMDSDDPVLGFSADDLLAYAEGAFSTDMLWIDDETSVPVDLTITYNGGLIELIDNEPLPTNSGTDVVQCTDSIAIEVDVHFSTADDSFNEDLTVHLTTDKIGQVVFSEVLDHTNLGGTFQFDQVDPSTYDTFRMNLFGAIAQDGSTRGDISAAGQVEHNGVELVDGFGVGGWPVADYL
jgi:hypothetical protein